MRGTLLLLALTALPRLAAAELDASLASRLGGVQHAFRDEDARAVREACSERTRVRVDLGDLTGGASSYGPGQLEVVMQAVFDQRHTTAFGFATDAIAVHDDGSAYAQAAWEHEREEGGGGRHTTLTFILRREDDDWRIVEMRASR